MSAHSHISSLSPSAISCFCCHTSLLATDGHDWAVSKSSPSILSVRVISLLPPPLKVFVNRPKVDDHSIDMWQQPVNTPKCDSLDTLARIFDWTYSFLVMMMFSGRFCAKDSYLLLSECKRHFDSRSRWGASQEAEEGICISFDHGL